MILQESRTHDSGDTHTHLLEHHILQLELCGTYVAHMWRLCREICEGLWYNHAWLDPTRCCGTLQRWCRAPWNPWTSWRGDVPKELPAEGPCTASVHGMLLLLPSLCRWKRSRRTPGWWLCTLVAWLGITITIGNHQRTFCVSRQPLQPNHCTTSHRWWLLALWRFGAKCLVARPARWSSWGLGLACPCHSESKRIQKRVSQWTGAAELRWKLCVKKQLWLLRLMNSLFW